MTLNLIWAQTSGGVIDRTGDLPWQHLPEDLARWQRLTAGGAVVMDRATWDAVPQPMGPRDDGDVIVVTPDSRWSAPGATVARDLAAALTATAGRRTWVVGGGAVHAELVDVADRVEITEVEVDVLGDTRAPVLGHRVWSSVTQAWRTSATGVPYRFASYVRAA